MTSQVTIIGCGVVGAVLAYELSKVADRADLQITVLEAKSKPAQGATGAALGVLMAACGHKLRGTLVSMRLASLRLYDDLVAELISQTQIEIPYYQAGILCLYGDANAEARCETLIPYRQKQGFPMHWLSQSELGLEYPQFQSHGGLYSPSDRAIHPIKFVQGLVEAAAANGVQFRWNCAIASLADLPPDLKSDWIVITSGLGANQLLAPLLPSYEELLQPVGGQAIRVHLPNLNLKPLNSQPIVHIEPQEGSNMNIVPLGNDQFWIGATMEFEASQRDQQLPTEANIVLLLDRAIEFCPEFAKATVLETWAGDRPQPKAHKAPILGFVPNHPNVLLAIGHYRNGILMAPLTAQITRDLILHGKSDLPWQKFSLQ
ncbi:FAD-dependent oxidoreductase [Tumidithrix elongata RA019]|uniref:FAD-dependent oxidoreductase n=1 Tax=Tumidithrix elongata BACA0141 TaxID=2716417 RepID=A0AAW9PXU4_9CYAN|nr:FAD-dependent oxidoreductase [Tumidithrix elongata RA019]